MNVITLWKCQEVVSRTTKAILYGNCYSFAARLFDILLFVKYMTKDSLFYEQLNQTGIRNNIQKLVFPNLFAESQAYLSTNIELARYIFSVCGNWDNYDSNKSTGVEEDNDNENIERKPLDNLYELYSVYN